LTADHIVPISLDGRSSEDNLQPLCGACNSRRGRPRKATSQQMAPSVDEQPLVDSEPNESELAEVDHTALEGLDLHAGQLAESDSTDAVQLYLREISRTSLLTLF